MLVAAAYAASALILFLKVGPWESIRHAVLGGLLAAAWITSARIILGSTQGPGRTEFRNPFLETLLLLIALLAMMASAGLRFLGLVEVPLLAYVMISAGTIVAIHLLRGYPLRTLGIRMPTRRAWVALLAIVLINALFGALYQLLPAGEGVTPRGADLAEGLTGPWGVLVLLGGLLLRAALPEELVLRVGLQTRFEGSLGVGFAILVQGLLFSGAHVPQQTLAYGRSTSLALAYVLPLENALIAGYLWYRTRSLPLLLLLHLFAFPRFGR
jgi:membrane protease YdiL (CAAX protease family)